MCEKQGKEKVETQLPHLWNPHKIRQDDLSEIKAGRITIQKERIE